MTEVLYTPLGQRSRIATMVNDFTNAPDGADGAARLAQLNAILHALDELEQNVTPNIEQPPHVPTPVAHIFERIAVAAVWLYAAIMLIIVLNKKT